MMCNDDARSKRRCVRGETMYFYHWVKSKQRGENEGIEEYLVSVANCVIGIL